VKIVYLTHNDVGSPLVRSQVLPYLRGLVAFDVQSELVTFERGLFPYPEDEFRRPLWHGLRARRGSHVLAKLLDVVAGLALVLWLTLRRRAAILHARSYLPAAIACVAGFLLRRPFVFDMRGFLGDEYVEGGHWQARDLRYKMLRLAERALLRAASEIVVLTSVAADRLRRQPPYAALVARTPITVVPCTVDLSRFRPLGARDSVPTVVYAGSLGMWYLLDEMLKVYVQARARVPALRFLILNRTEHAAIAQAVSRCDAPGGQVDVRAADFQDMPGLLGRAYVGIALLRQSESKLASSPIKVAEYLACGLPVIVNRGLGDSDELVRRYRAGHVVEDYAPEEIERAAQALVDLLDDSEARSNARRLAEAEYDVSIGVARYAAIYSRLAARPDPAGG
jgi:glycosyltransferase involved in cell wall biosynthesis